jgi:hypothetical protein
LPRAEGPLVSSPSERCEKIGLWCGSSETRRVDFGHFTGTEARVPVARAEGPAVSRGTRQGVACGGDDIEVRRTGTPAVSHLRRSSQPHVQSRPHGRAYALPAFQASTASKLRYRNWEQQHLVCLRVLVVLVPPRRHQDAKKRNPTHSADTRWDRDWTPAPRGRCRRSALPAS